MGGILEGDSVFINGQVILENCTYQNTEAIVVYIKQTYS